MKNEFDWLREQAKDKKSKELVDEIEKDKRLVEKEGKIIKSNKIFSINLGNFTIWLKKNGASSIMDTYLEIFKDKHYTILPEFSGKNDKVILDVGANEGYYTLKMKENNSNLKIYAIEPNLNTFEILKKNIKVNKLKNVILINKAITTKNSKINFQIIDEISPLSAVKIAKKSWLDMRRIKNIIVPSITISKLCKIYKIKFIDILKINVEGSEFEVLKSSLNFLKNIKKIVIEYHSKNLRGKCAHLLKNNGFKLVKEIKNNNRGDIYFIK